MDQMERGLNICNIF